MLSAHLISNFGTLTQNWLETRLVSLRRYRPLILTNQNSSRADLPFLVRSYSEASKWRKGRLALPALGPRFEWKHRLSRFFWEQLARSESALLHCHFGTVSVEHSALRRAVKERLGMRTVTSFYGFDIPWLLQSDPVVPREIFSSEDAFVLEGPFMASRLEAAGCPKEKLYVNPLGIDVDRFHPRKDSARTGDARVLAVGRLVEKKGFGDAIRAVHLARRQGAQLHLKIVGDGPQRMYLESIIHDLRCDGFVKLLGNVSYDVLLDLYHSSDILLQPSITATDGDTEGGAPVSIVEGMAAGLPVVATRHADIPNVVRHGETGILAGEGCVEELASALVLLSVDEEYRALLGGLGRARALSDFNAKIQGQRLEQIYDAITTGSPFKDESLKARCVA
jgi:colanic acid/amylovoran biosynthesis glycosyltransferase